MWLEGGDCLVGSFVVPAGWLESGVVLWAVCEGKIRSARRNKGVCELFKISAVPLCGCIVVRQGKRVLRS
jgi:hypothetical protein